MKIENSCTNKVAKRIIKQLGKKAVYVFEPDDGPENQEAAAQLMEEDGASCLKVFKLGEHEYWIINTECDQVVYGANQKN